MNGVVVHARQGLRERYRPLQSLLCDSAEPHAVVTGLMGLFAFRTFYVADLDALMGKPRQAAVIESLRKLFPDVVFWIDQGWPEHGLRGFYCPEDKAVTVIGSESLTEDRLPLLERGSGARILSLDFREGELIGPKPLLSRADLWPEQVILMSLARVGSTAGPDFARAEQFRQSHPSHRFIAAGGVRGSSDLHLLEELGLAGVLLASALHSGTLDARSLRRFG